MLCYTKTKWIINHGNAERADGPSASIVLNDEVMEERAQRPSVSGSGREKTRRRLSGDTDFFRFCSKTS